MEKPQINISSPYKRKLQENQEKITETPIKPKKAKTKTDSTNKETKRLSKKIYIMLANKV